MRRQVTDVKAGVAHATSGCSKRSAARRIAAFGAVGVCSAFGALSFMRSSHAAPPAGEARLIEALISYVAGMDAVFLRNGSSASAAEAAAHLRAKYAHFSDDINSADDFIRLCATRSAISGQAYLIRLPGGPERPAAEVLQERLLKLRRKASR